MNETPGEREFPDASETSSNPRLSFLVSKLMLEQKQNADNKENLAPRPPLTPAETPRRRDAPTALSETSAEENYSHFLLALNYLNHKSL